MNEWKKYINAFFITSAIFATALYIGNFFSNIKINELKTTGNRIAIDILSSETQFDLLGELSCPDAQNSTLSKELNSLGEKLDYSEEKFGTDDEDVISLKKQYSLLEIKDYLLIKKLKDCPKPPITILYFYGKNCPICDKEGYVLTRLHEMYPDLRVYSFDYDLDLSALKTLASIYDITREKLPAIVVKRNPYHGFKTVEEVKALIPELSLASTTEDVPNEKSKK